MSLEDEGTTGVAVEYREVSRATGKIRFSRRLQLQSRSVYPQAKGRPCGRARCAIVDWDNTAMPGGAAMEVVEGLSRVCIIAVAR
jgi:hypothetical protein